MIHMSRSNLQLWCDKGIVFSLCILVIFLPISIALVDSFAAFAIFFYLIKKISSGKGLFSYQNFLKRPLEILILVVFISVLQSQFFTTSLYAFLGKFLKGIFLYFCFSEAFTNEKRIQLFLRMFLGSVFLVSLSGLTQLYLGMDFLRAHPFVGSRITASLGQPNTFGAFLLLPLSVVGHLVYDITGKKEKSLALQIALMILLSVLLVCLCWTYSRASWLGYILSLFLMVILDKRKILFALALFLIVIYIFLPNLNNLRHMSLFKDNTEISLERKNGILNFIEGGNGRIEFWKNAVFIIKKYPVWGSGLNTYAKDLKRFSLPHWYAHNCYLQMGAEIGLIGLSSFLWMLWVFFSRSFHFLNRMSNESMFKPLSQGLLAGLGGLLLDSFFDNTLYTVQLGVFFWVMMGFAVAIFYLNPKGNFSSKSIV
jgi:O-antigen ligase